MAVNIPGCFITATKMASGNVRLTILGSVDGVNSDGAIRFALVIPAADFTSFNTTVNGGATNTTLSKAYAQDANRGDYDNFMVFDT